MICTIKYNEETIIGWKVSGSRSGHCYLRYVVPETYSHLFKDLKKVKNEPGGRRKGECEHPDAEIQQNIPQIGTLFSQHFSFNQEDKIKRKTN